MASLRLFLNLYYKGYLRKYYDNLKLIPKIKLQLHAIPSNIYIANTWTEFCKPGINDILKYAIAENRYQSVNIHRPFVRMYTCLSLTKNIKIGSELYAFTYKPITAIDTDDLCGDIDGSYIGGSFLYIPKDSNVINKTYGTYAIAPCLIWKFERKVYDREVWSLAKSIDPANYSKEDYQKAAASVVRMLSH